MATLETRLRALELRKKKAGPKDDRIEALIDAFLQSFQSDEPDRVPGPGKGQIRLVYPNTWQSDEDKRQAFVERVRSGMMTGEDSVILDRLEPDARAVMGMTGKEFVLFIGDMQMQF
ncbi:MAG: hypothetical protein B7X10_02055 [Burkholderiales bacterium 21-58-4]|nr:MAG: hypothetical protein B7X10_02055 [Burkholderiales bacterium 21-58-4]